MGDFLIGTLFLRELSSPFLAAAKIMRKVSQFVTLSVLDYSILRSKWKVRYCTK